MAEKNSDNLDNTEDFKNLQRGMQACHDKLSGKNSDPIALEDVLIYLRGINHNFNALLRILNGLTIKTVDIQTQISLLFMPIEDVQTNLKLLTDTNSLIDETLNSNNAESDK